MRTRRPRHSVALLALVAVATVANGCGDSSGGDAARAEATGDTKGTDAERASAPPESVVRDIDPSAADAISRLNEVALGPDAIASLAPLLGDEDAVIRWAALYVVAIQADSRDEGSVLVPLLADEDPATRVIAAGSLAGLGYPETLPVLVEGLSESGPLPFSDPPRPVADLAREALAAYTGEDLAGADAWREWLGSASPLEWDGEMYVGS